MGITSEWQNGALVGVDGWSRSLFEAAFGRKLYGHFEHFAPSLLIDTTHYAGFTVTGITASSTGTLVMADAVGGWLNFTGGTHDGAGIQMQSMGEMYLPADSKDIWFEAEIQLADADDIDWFLGLAVTDTNVFSTDPASLIAFRGDDGDANIDFQVRSGGTGSQADTTHDAANATAVRLGFQVRGVTDVVPYVNGVALAAVTANVPAAELALSFGMLNGATTTNNTLGLNWYRILQFV